MKLQVSADSRDEKLGIVKKKVHIGDFSFTTPTKSTKYNNNELYQGEKKRVNEITRSLKIDHLSNFHDEENYSARFVKDVRKQFLDESLNLPIFNINSTQLPNPEHTKTLGHVIYAASDKIVCLPTVKKSAYCVMELTSGGKPVQKIRDNSFDKYINFQKTIIDELKLSNSKEILGMIPFLSPKFSIKLLDTYFEQGINSFVIDGNLSNLFNREPDLRRLLSYINEKAKQSGSSLAQTYLHAVNLGTNNFTAESVPADDFLNFFTYIDVVGTNSKTRFAPTRVGYPKTEPKKKVFMREKYSYDLVERLPNIAPYSEFRKQSSIPKIKKYNEKEQYLEAKNLNSNIGQINMTKHLENKKGLTQTSWKCLRNIFEHIRFD